MQELNSEQIVTTEHGRRVKITARIMPKEQANEWLRQNSLHEVD